MQSSLSHLAGSDTVLASPLDYPDPDSFCWEKYLEETGTSAVPTWAFKVVSRLLPSLEPSLGSCGPVSQPEEGHNQDSLPCSSLLGASDLPS